MCIQCIYEKFENILLYPNGVSDDDRFYSHQFSPAGQAGGAPRLRYSGFAIAYYGFSLKCLAYGSPRLVQNTGNTSGTGILHAVQQAKI
jgi:hypothetical protein